MMHYWPQAIILATIIIRMSNQFRKIDDEAKGSEIAGESAGILAAAAFTIWVLYMGGFWS